VNNSDVLEQRSATIVRGLEARNDRLQKALDAANREFESFSYSVAHDLRTPLLHIDGFAQLLRESAGAGLDDESRDHLARIVSAAASMQVHIEALLEYSNINRAELVLSDVDMETLLDEVLAVARSRGSGRNIQWQRTRLPTVQADATLLRQVLMDLVVNAVKYTRTRDPAIIEIGAREGQPEAITVFVRDNGVGFDLKYAGRLFTPFQRMHSTDAFQGIGMGLAKARRIVVRHGGALWAESEPDKGATFFFRLPLSADA